MGDPLSRLAFLEAILGQLSASLQSVQARLTQAESKIQQLGFGGASGTGSGASCLFAMTPSGGIPALTGTSAPYTPGVATCEIWKYDGTHIVDAGYTAQVRNSVPAAVGATQTRLVQVKTIDSKLWVDVDPCTWPPTS